MSVVSKDALGEFESHIESLGRELSGCVAGSDEGLVPVYSILNDCLGVAPEGEGHVRVALMGCRVMLEGLLNNAKPFSASEIGVLSSCVPWLEGAVETIRGGGSVEGAFQFSEPDEGLEEALEREEASESSGDLSRFDVMIELDDTHDPEIVSEFVQESREHLEEIESSLMELDSDPGNREMVDSLFRSFHTIKGVSGFLHFASIKELTHEIETLLDLVRQGEVAVNSGMISLILDGKDRTSSLIGQVADAASSGENPGELIPVSDLIKRVHSAARGEASQEESGSPAVAAPAKTSPKKSGGEGASVIRVNTKKLDTLLDLVGELVIVQSQLKENMPDDFDEESHFSHSMMQLSRITKDLQNDSMNLRMIPVKSTFQKLSRIVRDLSQSLNKEVNVELVGEETEFDRGMVEQIADPLIHMVRNAIDHGIEGPEERLRAGKPAVGTCLLKAYHEGGDVIVEISDDGKGIDHNYIHKKALEKELIDPAREYLPEEIYRFLFLPGFSTAQEVTDVSGRGVGMDVVLRNIENLQGQVDISSSIGKGSVFKIRIPLTMAIIDGITVRVGSERLIIPVSAVQVSLKARSEDLTLLQGEVEMLSWQGHSVPIVRVHSRLNIPVGSERIEDGIVVIVNSGGKYYGLLVDTLESTQEIVIKNLGAALSRMYGISGCAIMGDGLVSLILDIGELTSQGVEKAS